jgi:hypothetical protein
MSGLKDTISRRLKLCEVGRNCMKMATNARLNARENIKNKGVTPAMTATDVNQAIARPRVRYTLAKFQRKKKRSILMKCATTAICSMKYSLGSRIS